MAATGSTVRSSAFRPLGRQSGGDRL